MKLSPSWEAANCAATQEIIPAIYGTRRFITVLTRALHWSLSWARPIQSILSHLICLRSILILPSHLRLGFPSGLLLSGFPTNIHLKKKMNRTRFIHVNKNWHVKHAVKDIHKRVIWIVIVARVIEFLMVLTPSPTVGNHKLIHWNEILHITDWLQRNN
jgi:hypothetical protein